MDEQLQVILYKEQRVVTTQRIAEVYGTAPRRVSENYNANKDRYIEGKHYYCLEGDELRDFKDDYYGNSVVVDNRAPSLYLWTKHGAFLHAKSLNTDKAWEAYNQLVDNYFLQLDQIAMLQQQVAELERRLSLIDSKPKQLRLPGTRQLPPPDRGYHVTNDSISISHEQKKALLREYVYHYWDLYGEGVTSARLVSTFVKRFSSDEAQPVLEEIACEDELEQYFTAHAHRGKFKG